MGIYFATGSRDKTARLWSTDRTSALRIYAGHLNDVDVSTYLVFVLAVLLRRVFTYLSLVCEIPSKFTIPCHWFK